MRALRIVRLATCLGLTAAFAGCEGIPAPSRSAQPVLQMAPMPANPVYMTASFRSPFFVPTRSGSYEAIGMLPKGIVVVLRGRERSWADIQLASGHLGSVLFDSLRFLTPEEASELPIHGSPDMLEPLPVAEDGSGSGIDSSLLPDW